MFVTAYVCDCLCLWLSMFVTAPTPIGTIAFTQWTVCKISASTHKKIHKIQKKILNIQLHSKSQPAAALTVCCVYELWWLDWEFVWNWLSVCKSYGAGLCVTTHTPYTHTWHTHITHSPRAEEIGLIKQFALPKFQTSFHGSPRDFQTNFHGSPQNSKQTFTEVNGSPCHSKEWTGKLSNLEIQIFWVWSPPWAVTYSQAS